MSSSLTKDSIHIREVWNDNLEQEFKLIRDIVDDYPYVGMDTEFPGTVVTPVGNFNTRNEFNYESLKENVNRTKLIQLGLTFSDEKGNLPTCGTDKYCIWQVNLCEFDPDKDVGADDSIEILRESGIDFKKNNEKGVVVHTFSQLLMSSGAVMNDNVHWLTFHGSSDFGYLLKLLTWRSLPDTQEGFFRLMQTFFPKFYDIKHLIRFYGLHGGLNKLAVTLQVERYGTSHQAGSDSLLTTCIFMKVKEALKLVDSLEKHAGVLFGLGERG